MELRLSEVFNFYQVSGFGRFIELDGMVDLMGDFLRNINRQKLRDGSGIDALNCFHDTGLSLGALELGLSKGFGFEIEPVA